MINYNEANYALVTPECINGLDLDWEPHSLMSLPEKSTVTDARRYWGKERCTDDKSMAF